MQPHEESYHVANNRQLLWGVNISLRRRLTLMLLFSGAVFIILASTIRAVTILTASLLSPRRRLMLTILLVWPRWRCQRQLMGLPRVLRRHRCHQFTHHPPSAPTTGQSHRSRYSPEHQEQIEIAKLSIARRCWDRGPERHHQENAHAHAHAHAPALCPERLRVGQ